MFRGIRLSALGVTLSALVALHGCGGSGSDDGDDSRSLQGGRTAPGDEVQAARVAAAGAIPKEGSVTQSSDIDGSGVTEDVVEVELTPNGDDGFHVKVMYNGQEAVDTEDATAKKGVEYVLDRPKGTQYMERFTYSDSKAVEFYRSLADGDLTGVPAGDLWVDVYTNFGEGDVTEDDYLAGGIWVYIPDDGTADDYEFGAFADGAAPYPEADIAGLIGEAEYDGGATGVYSYGTNGGRRNEFFDATVELTADFDDTTLGGVGTIGGRIHTFIIDEEEVAGDPVLSLNPANFDDGSNFFTGATSGDFEGETYTGNWGGQFYNDTNDQTTDDYPGAVAGTFGAANDDESVVGVFGAYHEPPATN